ncbi:MAG: helix-turn-helix domain-containing protein [Ruminococcaceae bacterium]|nr:helix-turn-helix domain-containing protein [Oscillospiraceae bacterium]
MIKKDTSELLRELESYSDFKRFYNENGESLLQKKTLGEYLGELIRSHGIKKADAIRRSELSEVYAYQIFSGMRVPERKKLLALAVGMGLKLSEIQELLKVSGYAPLYVKNPFDCIVIWGICKGLTVAEINYTLFDYGEETLG